MLGAKLCQPLAFTAKIERSVHERCDARCCARLLEWRLDLKQNVSSVFSRCFAARCCRAARIVSRPRSLMGPWHDDCGHRHKRRGTSSSCQASLRLAATCLGARVQRIQAGTHTLLHSCACHISAIDQTMHLPCSLPLATAMCHSTLQPQAWLAPGCPLTRGLHGQLQLQGTHRKW